MLKRVNPASLFLVLGAGSSIWYSSNLFLIHRSTLWDDSARQVSFLLRLKTFLIDLWPLVGFGLTLWGLQRRRTWVLWLSWALAVMVLSGSTKILADVDQIGLLHRLFNSPVALFGVWCPAIWLVYSMSASTRAQFRGSQ